MFYLNEAQENFIDAQNKKYSLENFKKHPTKRKPLVE